MFPELFTKSLRIEVISFILPKVQTDGVKLFLSASEDKMTDLHVSTQDSQISFSIKPSRLAKYAHSNMFANWTAIKFCSISILLQF